MLTHPVGKLRLDIWSDIACPWCYIGKRHLEQALAKFPHAADVELVWRAFELDPEAPARRDDSQSFTQRLAAKYGMSVAEAQRRIDQVIATGAKAGIEFRYDHMKSGNTFDAHRLLHWAHEQGKQGALKERMMRAYMTDGLAIGEPDVLAGLAADVGLDAAEARAILAGDRYRDAVRADEARARELGISGVPFFVMAGRIGVSGAQPAEVLVDALTQAWETATTGGAIVDGAACGPDGC